MGSNGKRVKKKRNLRCFFSSLVLCQNNYQSCDGVIDKVYDRTNFFQSTWYLESNQKPKKQASRKSNCAYALSQGFFYPVFIFFFPVNLHCHSSELEYSEK